MPRRKKAMADDSLYLLIVGIVDELVETEELVLLGTIEDAANYLMNRFRETLSTNGTTLDILKKSLAEDYSLNEGEIVASLIKYSPNEVSHDPICIGTAPISESVVSGNYIVISSSNDDAFVYWFNERQEAEQVAKSLADNAEDEDVKIASYHLYFHDGPENRVKSMKQIRCSE